MNGNAEITQLLPIFIALHKRWNAERNDKDTKEYLIRITVDHEKLEYAFTEFEIQTVTNY